MPVIQETLHIGNKRSIILLDGTRSKQAQQNTELNIIDVQLEFFDEPIHVRIGFRDSPATLADITPVARALSTKIMGCVEKKTIRSGFAIPCHKGCGLCCQYLISLSVPEAFRLVRETMMMRLVQREKIMNRCFEISQWLQKQLRNYYTAKKSSNGDNLNPRQLKEIAEWYFKEEISCPFLHNNMCTIYSLRPMVCREHLVAGSTSPCGNNGTSNSPKVQVPVRIEIALKLMTSKLEQTRQESIVLPCIFDWFLNNKERCNRTWPAKMLVEHFVKAVYEAEHYKPM